MPRMARIVVPDYPHHVTQRGCRRQQTFFDQGDYRTYIDLLATRKTEVGVEIWAYCLMPNHVHLIAVPSDESSLAKLFRTVHRQYSLQVNAAHDWRGHLWQERFHSFVMDEPHLFAALRYVEMNPVRAGLCNSAGDWPWSSARAHLYNKSDKLVSPAPIGQHIHNWRDFLAQNESPDVVASLRGHTQSGRPAGTQRFIERLETLTGRRLKVQRPGPKSHN
jgi:putative transposase